MSSYRPGSLLHSTPLPCRSSLHCRYEIAVAMPLYSRRRQSAQPAGTVEWAPRLLHCRSGAPSTAPWCTSALGPRCAPTCLAPPAVFCTCKLRPRAPHSPVGTAPRKWSLDRPPCSFPCAGRGWGGCPRPGSHPAAPEGRAAAPPRARRPRRAAAVGGPSAPGGGR
jgi:hypothetical protein